MHMPLFRCGDTDSTDCLKRSHYLIMEYLQLPEGSCLLDVGCGIGAFSIHAASALHLNITGIALTNSEVSFAVARAESAGQQYRCHFQVHDMNELSTLGCGRFNAVVNLESDCYYTTLSHAVKQVTTVLVDGGVWHTLRYSISKKHINNQRAVRLARRIASCWRTAEWHTTECFESAVHADFETVKNEDLSQSVFAFWSNFMPLHVENSLMVRARFAVRALHESPHAGDFLLVYRHRIAFWLFMIGLSRGWLEYRYHILRKRLPS
jgi:cyclopropane fatty-acyl-phospholipid synthase-like methyltransferase